MTQCTVRPCVGRLGTGRVLVEGVGLGITAVRGTGIAKMYDIAARPFIEDRTLELILRDKMA